MRRVRRALGSAAELGRIENSPAHWRVGDDRALVKRATSTALSGGGSANQALIDEGNAWERSRCEAAVRIATYNVNGINGRLPNLLPWLAEAAPDIVCLQELKAPDEKSLRLLGSLARLG